MNNYFMGDLKPEKPTNKNEILTSEAPVSKMRKAGGRIATWLVNNHAGLLSILLLVFALLVMFTDDMNLEGVFWQRVVSPETLILATCSYLLYINSYVIGSNVASKTDFATSITTTYADHISKIRSKRIEWLIELFCSDYRMRELRYTRTDILLCAGFTEAQTLAIIEGKEIDLSKVTEEQKKALAKAQSLKPIKLTKNMLVNAKNEHSERSPIRSARAIEIEKYRAFAFKLFTIIISFTFVVSLSISLVQDFSAEAIFSAMFQLALMLISLFSGISLGYRIKIKYTERLQDIVGVLYEFWEWFEARENQAKNSADEQ
jgi:hypothetical protein